MSFLRRGISSLPVQALLVPALWVTGLHGQAAPPQGTPAPQAPPTGVSSSVQTAKGESTDLKKKNYVKIFSGGVTLSVLGQIPISNGGYSETRTNFTLDAGTAAEGYRIGFGGMVQVRLPKKFAFAVSVLQHKSGHSTTVDQYEGVDNPNTPLDDRIHTTIAESSVVKYWDYTFLVRRYTKSHQMPGPRAFFEGGINLRDVRNVRTTRETTVGATITEDTIPVVPARGMSRGFVGGVGAQFIDDFGIKLVPEFRYTRWIQQSFDSLSTQSRKNQFEAIVSITF